MDEKSFVAILGKWHPEQRQSFRKGTQFFVQDERSFERWADEHVKKLSREFQRFKVIYTGQVMLPSISLQSGVKRSIRLFILAQMVRILTEQ